jgi:23S rRNA pseudouridine2605 synthase
MRINKFVALATGLSRRAADATITDYRVGINGKTAQVGSEVNESDTVTLDGRAITPPVNMVTIMLNKPAGYIVSRDGQGSDTIYDLLPYGYDRLKPVGRLDKDSSGLLLLTNDGDLANTLTHPSYQKQKVYEVTLDKPLQPLHRQMISDHGITLEDGVSKFELERLADGDDHRWKVIMSEGRNRQIRRTFASLDYKIVRLHRTVFGPYALDGLAEGSYKEITLS